MRVRFGDFMLDAEARQFMRAGPSTRSARSGHPSTQFARSGQGEEVHLSPKAFDLLCILLAKRPNVVSKADLFAQIWPNTFVVEANLNVLIAEVRRACGDEARAPLFIKTAHGVGYSFCGEATEVEGPAPRSGGGVRCWLAWRQQTFPLAPGDNVIGRDPRCNVWLDHDGVSRRHATIQVTGDARPVVEDLASTNGTFVNGKRVVAVMPLGDGDLIKVGSVSLKFREWSDGASRTKRIRGSRSG